MHGQAALCRLQGKEIHSKKHSRTVQRLDTYGITKRVNKERIINKYIFPGQTILTDLHWSMAKGKGVVVVKQTRASSVSISPKAGHFRYGLPESG